MSTQERELVSTSALLISLKNSLLHDTFFDIKFRLPDQFTKLCLSVFRSELTKIANKLNQQQKKTPF